MKRRVARPSDVKNRWGLERPRASPRSSSPSYAVLAGSACRRAIAAPPTCRLPTPSSEFSAARALTTVRALTATGLPHPPGSANHLRVQRVVVDHLRALGLAPAPLQAALECGRGGCVDVVNVVARIPGASPGRRCSSPRTTTRSRPAPARATTPRARPPCSRSPARCSRGHAAPPGDLLIDDGEEAGLLGARAFVREHRGRRGACRPQLRGARHRRADGDVRDQRTQRRARRGATAARASARSPAR